MLWHLTACSCVLQRIHVCCSMYVAACVLMCVASCVLQRVDVCCSMCVAACVCDICCSSTRQCRASLWHPVYLLTHFWCMCTQTRGNWVCPLCLSVNTCLFSWQLDMPITHVCLFLFVYMLTWHAHSVCLFIGVCVNGNSACPLCVSVHTAA